MESLNIDPSVTVKLPTLVWFHICPQACRHGVARVPDVASSLERSSRSASVWVRSASEKSRYRRLFGGFFSRRFLPDSCCTFLHLSECFSSSWDCFFFFHLDQRSLCKDMNTVAASRPFLQFWCRKKKKRHWICCMIECKTKNII